MPRVKLIADPDVQYHYVHARRKADRLVFHTDKKCGSLLNSVRARKLVAPLTIMGSYADSTRRAYNKTYYAICQQNKCRTQ